MARNRLIPAALAAVCLVFGTTFLAIKIGVMAGAPPFLFSGTRFCLAGLILASIVLASGKTSIKGLLRLAPRAAAVSVLYIVVKFGATFWAEGFIDSATAAQIDAICPIVAAALSAIFLKKRLGPLHLLGIFAGFAGVCLIVWGPSIGAPRGALSSGGTKLAASLVMVAGSVAFAASQVLYRRLFGEADDPIAVNSLNMFIGGIGLLILSAAFERRPFPASSAAFLSLAYLIVFGSLVAHSLNLWVVKRAGPLYASSWSYVSPAIATVVGAIFYGERISGFSIAGMAATLAGVGAIAWAERRSS